MVKFTEKKIIDKDALKLMVDTALAVDADKQAKAYETLAAIFKQQAKIIKEKA